MGARKARVPLNPAGQRAYLARRRITQTRIAAAYGCGVPHVCQVLAGKRWYSRKLRERMARVIAQVAETRESD